MSSQLYAHWLDRKSKHGIAEDAIANLDLGRGGGLLPELLDLKPDNPHAKSLLDAGTKVPKATVESAFRECCRKYLDGDDFLWEIHFLATILMKWKRAEKSVFFQMG